MAFSRRRSPVPDRPKFQNSDGGGFLGESNYQYHVAGVAGNHAIAAVRGPFALSLSGMR